MITVCGFSDCEYVYTDLPQHIVYVQSGLLLQILQVHIEIIASSNFLV